MNDVLRIHNESNSNLDKWLKCNAWSFHDVHYQFHIRIFTSQNKMFSDIVKYMCRHIRKKKILQKSGIHFLHSFIKINFVRKKNNLFKIWSFYVCMIIFAIVEFNCTCTCMFNYTCIMRLYVYPREYISIPCQNWLTADIKITPYAPSIPTT